MYRHKEKSIVFVIFLAQYIDKDNIGMYNYYIFIGYDGAKDH